MIVHLILFRVFAVLFVAIFGWSLKPFIVWVVAVLDGVPHAPPSIKEMIMPLAAFLCYLLADAVSRMQ
jgi:hypothetical protein